MDTDKLSDYAAVILAVGTYLVILLLIISQYRQTGTLNEWALTALAIMGGVSVIALFGYERLEKIVKILRD